MNTEEKNDVKFQTYFFDALKQKAIQNYSKAVESLERCYEIDSTNLATEFEFSKNYFLLKNYFEAAFFIEKALEKKPNNIFLLKHKVAVLKAQQEYNRAIEIQKKIIQLQPRYSDELVLLYIQNQQIDKAEKLIAEIEEKALTTSRIKSYKKYLINKKALSDNTKPKKTIENQNTDIESLKKGFSEKKDYNTLREILTKEAENKLFEALQNDSKEGLELFPAQPFLYLMNGQALNSLGKYNEAISVLSIGIDFVIDDKGMEADFYEQYSAAYEGLNNTKEALKYKQKALQLRQEN